MQIIERIAVSGSLRTIKSANDMPFSGDPKFSGGNAAVDLVDWPTPGKTIGEVGKRGAENRNFWIFPDSFGVGRFICVQKNEHTKLLRNIAPGVTHLSSVAALHAAAIRPQTDRTDLEGSDARRETP